MGIEFDRSRPGPVYVNRERIEHLAMQVRETLKTYTDALEDELAAAIIQGDHQNVAAIAWDYGPATGLLTDIEINFGDAIEEIRQA